MANHVTGWSFCALTITFFTRLRAFELRHFIALRMTFVAVGDAIDAANRGKDRRTNTG